MFKRCVQSSTWHCNYGYYIYSWKLRRLFVWHAHIINVEIWKHISDSFLPAHFFFYLEVEHVSYHWEETWVDLQSNLILVNIAACLHWDWRAASSLHVFHCRRKEACVEMQSGCCQCSSAHTHIRTCVLVKCSSTRCFRFIIILLLCWQLYNSPNFEVISFCICYEENLYIYRKKSYIYTTLIALWE